MTMIEVLIGANTLALVACLLVFTRLASRIGRAADDVGLAARHVAEITPAARTFIEAGRAELEALRALTGTMSAVAENARTVSGHASAVTSQLRRGIDGVVFNRYHAVFAGIRAAAGVLGRLRGRNGAHRSELVEVEEFDDIQR